MNPRRVSALRGWRWVVEGFSLFTKSPLIWVALFAVSALGMLILARLPYVGPLLVELFWPVLMGGFMLGCQALDSGEDLEIGHLVQGMRVGGAQLVTVGGIYLVGSIVINKVMFLVGGPEMAKLLVAGSQKALDQAALSGSSNAILLAVAIGMLLLTPLAMAAWFAPALVVFRGIGAITAMKQSFFACVRNIGAFMVYGLASFVLTVIAIVPMYLGLVILVPVLIASFYAGYKDVFPPDPQAA